MNTFASDVYLIEGVPKEFSQMTEAEFEEFLLQVPLGSRLKCFASWSERLYVAAFLEILNSDMDSLRSELPKNQNKAFTNRERYLLFGLVRWFGTNCGRSFVHEVMTKCNGRFFSVWDGQNFWYPGNAKTKAYTVGQLLDAEPPPPWGFFKRKFSSLTLTSPDLCLVTAFMRWLSRGDGAQFMERVLNQISDERARLDQERRDEMKRQQIEHLVDRFRIDQYQQAGLSPA